MIWHDGPRCPHCGRRFWTEAALWKHYERGCRKTPKQKWEKPKGPLSLYPNNRRCS
jgi:hypothetical protein